MAISAVEGDQEGVNDYARIVVNERKVSCHAMYTIPRLALYRTDDFENPEFKSIVRELNFPEGE